MVFTGRTKKLLHIQTSNNMRNVKYNEYGPHCTIRELTGNTFEDNKKKLVYLNIHAAAQTKQS